MRTLLLITVGLITAFSPGCNTGSIELAKIQELKLSGQDISVSLNKDSRLTVTGDDGSVVWESPAGEPSAGIALTDFGNCRIEKPASEGGYMVLPHGSGYLIDAGYPDSLTGSGMIGGRWTLPLFGITYGNGTGICAIAENWQDCMVDVEHLPGKHSALNLSWEGESPRRLILQSAKDMDHVRMAKIYRTHAAEQGLLQTLKEKSAHTPVIKDYVNNILFRWNPWDAGHAQAVLSDIRRLREMGFGITFFFPKWPSEPGKPAEGTWPSYLRSEPVEGGWPVLADYAEKVRELGCQIQAFILLREEAPFTKILDNIKEKGLNFDALYFDGYSAFRPLDFAEQIKAFDETRRRGLMPGGELARFWCIPHCDFFFFTDWSDDRLSNTGNKGSLGPVGEPVPLFQLVFHDCYMAGFSGGGYAAYSSGYDWWADRTPRLYELLFTAAPAYNWLPTGANDVPIEWDNPQTERRLNWLKRWSTYYRAIAMSEMTSHEFLSNNRKLQRITFANGITAEFNMNKNEFRIKGIEGFTGEWEKPDDL